MMSAAEAGRDEIVKVAANGFGGLAAENPLRRQIEQNDALAMIHRDDGVHR
jgi:hypothetical protein